MRIAQIAPLAEAVPPKLYGGTERVVHYLTEELAAQGHDVTLFASGDSVTSARLVPCCPKALRLDDCCTDTLVHHILQLEAVMSKADRFDILHFHIDYLHYPFARRSRCPTLTTLHGRQDLRDLRPLHQEFTDLPLVSISNSQRRPCPDLHWAGTVHHGLPADVLSQGSGKGGYLAFLGRFSPEKGFERAVEIARRAGVPLKAAAKAEPLNKDYFDAVVQPLLADPLVEWVGEIGERDKGAFLGEALAHLFPINWPEPFGLVMIEAMACGTPTIAWPCGSVPEIIENGKSGFVVSSVDEAIAAIAACRTFDRSQCRAAFERRFTATRMAEGYLSLYRRLATPRLIKPVAGGRI